MSTDGKNTDKSTINDWGNNRGGGDHSHWSSNDGTSSGGCHHTNISEGTYSNHEFDGDGNLTGVAVNDNSSD